MIGICIYVLAPVSWNSFLLLAKAWTQPKRIYLQRLEQYRSEILFECLEVMYKHNYTPGRGNMGPCNVNNKRLTTSEWHTKIQTTPS